METNSQSCPKCGYMREPNAAECPACGIIYARYQANPQRRPQAGTYAAEPTADLNPYAAPRSNVAAPALAPMGKETGVWRSGPVLVMEKHAALPNRCVTCNQPAHVRLPRKLYWHSPFIYLLILISILIYALVALIVRKKAEVDIPLCLEHDERRKRGITTAWIICLASIAAFAAGIAKIDDFGYLLLIGIFGLLGGLIYGSVRSRPVVPKKIDDSYVWLTKISPDFLGTLPQAPPGF